MVKIRVSGVSIGQWKNLCKKDGNSSTEVVKEKILRAVVLGKPNFKYDTKDYILRYYDLNILVSRKGLVLTVWRHIGTKKGSKPVEILEEFKESVKNYISSEELQLLANEKHRDIIAGEFNA